MRRKEEYGLALLIVMFIVALASMLVVNLTYSTYLGSRISVTAERSVQAEYLLKAALNYAMVLIKEDVEPGDSAKDIWGKYAYGLPLQRTDLIPDVMPNIPVSVEIRPEGAKLDIRRLTPPTLSGAPDNNIRDVLSRLFTNVQVGWEFDKEDFIAPDGQSFQFKSKDLIANLIDYMDQDENAYSDGSYQGIEGPNSLFPNREITRIGELSAVPGYTASRVRKLLPYLTTLDNRQVNVNLASKAMLMSLSDDLTSEYADQIIEFRKSDAGPFKNPTDLQNILTQTIYDDIKNLVAYESGSFQVLSKVEYSTSVFFLRAYLKKSGRKQLPDIRTIELF